MTLTRHLQTCYELPCYSSRVNRTEILEMLSPETGTNNDINSTAAQRLKAQTAQISNLWADRCIQQIDAAQACDRHRFLDSLPRYLDKLAEALDTKSDLAQANEDNALAALHGAQRTEFSEYSVKAVLAEYTILLSVLDEVLGQSAPMTPGEYRIITQSILQAASEAAQAYVSASKQRHASNDRQFELLVNEVKDYAIFMIDPDGVVCTWNEGARRIKQYEQSEVVGQNYAMLYLPEDRRAGRPTRNLRLAKQDGLHMEQWWRQKKDGGAFWAEVSMTPIYENGKHLGFVKVVHDLTERKRIADELAEAKLGAEESSRAKTAFLANVSHEIRTPLNAILGFTAMLRSDDLDPKERARFVDIIDRNGRALVGLIDDILDVSKVEAGKLKFEKTPFEIRHLITEITGLFEARADEKGVAFFSRVKSSVPQQLVSDPLRVRQVLNNIVGNAIKFTKEGQVQLTVEEIAASPRPILQITVVDTGPGIPKDKRDRLFEPFVQADESTTRQFGGTGLGLALSRRLARELGGDIQLGECETEHGCTFIITLANYIDELESDEAKRTALLKNVAPPAPKRFLETANIDLSQKQILIAEDSEDNQLLIRKLLEKTKAAITIVDNGAEAVAKASEQDFDVVIMDVQMPVLDGNSAAKKLRSLGYEKPLIALTAHAMPEEVRRCLDSGFDTHLGKPIDSGKLLRTLEALC